MKGDAGVGDADSDSETFHWDLPNGCRLRWQKDRSRRRAVVFPCLWSQKVDSAGGNLGKSGGGKSFWSTLWAELALARTANPLRCIFILDQRAQPRFKACKHSETSAAESMIFPPRALQVDILKQTVPHGRPHLWPLRAPTSNQKDFLIMGKCHYGFEYLCFSFTFVNFLNLLYSI